MFTVTEPKDVGAIKANQKEVFILESIGGRSFLTAFDCVNNKPANPRSVHPEALIEKLSGNSIQTSFIDERILVKNSQMIVWTYTPPKGQLLHYRHNGKTLVAPIQWNNLIFKKHGRALSVVAVRSKKRPSLTTRVYHAPIPNVYTSGNICLGNVSLPETDNIDDLAQVYLQSTKTHLNNSIFLRKHAKDKSLTSKVYYEWIKTKTENPILVSELSVYGTLNDFIFKGE